MDEYRITAFEPAHALAMKVRSEERRNYDNPDFGLYLDRLHKTGNCFTVTHGNDVVFCGGVTLIPNSGTGEAWVLTSAQVWRHARKLLQVSESVLDIVATDYNLQRLQAHVRTDWKAAISFVERLGFDREGRLRKYNNGQDYFIYARVK